MVTIEGPSQNVSGYPQDVDYLQVNEQEPAEFYCEFIRHDMDDNDAKYRFRTYIDIVNPAIHNTKRELNVLTQPGPHTPNGHNFSITNTEISSTDNVTIYKTQIIFLSINLDTPILSIKCAVAYGLEASNLTLCLTSSTFAVIPNHAAPVISCSSTTEPITTSTPIPTKTTSPSTSLSPSIIPARLCHELGYLSSLEFAPVVTIMGLIITIETILLIVCIFVKYKKSQDTSNAVIVINHRNDENGADASKGKAAHVQLKKDQELPHLVPDDDCLNDIRLRS